MRDANIVTLYKNKGSVLLCYRKCTLVLQTGGFFVEAGAVDGELNSNTLFLERTRNWTGLLIEPFPEMYKDLVNKHRKAYSINAALAVSNVSAQVPFISHGHKGSTGHISGMSNDATYSVKALPLYSILLALNVTVVDFLSLDINGDELKVLQTTPWNKVKVRLICVGLTFNPDGEDTLKEFMNKQGYKHLVTRNNDVWFGWPDLLNQTMKKNETFLLS
ncbi:protein Star-like [Procambarus clarkii]|uniref:protein Star-like n=1 Tax=Procambarus clarkii TaxID=6728 RepID=UPI0037445FA2